MKNALFGAVAFVAMGAVPAFAGPITPGSTMSIVGVDSVSATSISFPSPGSLLVSTGDFAGLGSCVGCVALNTITYSPAVSSGVIYTVANAGQTASFSLDPGAIATVVPGSPGAIDIIGTGTITLTGYDPTSGNFAFSTQNGLPQNLTFSATLTAGEAVPEPVSLALFGTAILGLGLVRWSRKHG